MDEAYISNEQVIDLYRSDSGLNCMRVGECMRHEMNNLAITLVIMHYGIL